MLRTIIQKNLKNWENCLSFVDFEYNRNVHSTIDYFPFKIIYEFNLLTPLDLIHIHIDDKRVSLNGNKKTQVVKALYESV